MMTREQAEARARELGFDGLSGLLRERLGGRGSGVATAAEVGCSPRELSRWGRAMGLGVYGAREQAEARARELGFGSLAGCLGMYPTWSQRELAERLGVSRGAIEHWLRHGVEMGDGVGLGAGGHGERAIRGAGQRRSRRQRQEIVIEAVRRAAARVDSPAARRSLIWAEMVEEGLAA